MALAVVLSSASGIALGENPPEVSHDGLRLQPDTKFGLVYLRPGADFSHYDRIALLQCEVAFRKDWQRDQNRDRPMSVSKADMDQMRTQLSEAFAEIFEEELSKGGYQWSDVAAPDVLILRPAIVNLDVTAPAAADMGRGRTYAASAGEMTLYLEVYDSTTGEIIARIADREAGSSHGAWRWQSSVSNRAEAKRVLREWAVNLRGGLDVVRAAGVVVPAS